MTKVVGKLVFSPVYNDSDVDFARFWQNFDITYNHILSMLVNKNILLTDDIGL